LTVKDCISYILHVLLAASTLLNAQSHVTSSEKTSNFENLSKTQNNLLKSSN